LVNALVTAPELLAALRRIEERGAVDTAHRTLQGCSRIFRYAVATGRAERDTAADLRGALAQMRGGHFSSITDTADIGALLRDIDAYTGNIVVRAALRIAPHVFVRPGELLRAEWEEFDLAGAEWRIPAERMKMRVVHIVPLSRQVVEILTDLHRYTGQPSNPDRTGVNSLSHGCPVCGERPYPHRRPRRRRGRAALEVKRRRSKAERQQRPHSG
jgi:integrase